ncbi:MAG: CRTAC1 family protein [Myxococcales bacterium]|nr:CRTAC1 family protein [Myxococcales bacterium]
MRRSRARSRSWVGCVLTLGIGVACHGPASDTGDASTSDGLACMVPETPALPGPPFDPAICGSWTADPLAPANPPPPAACGAGGPCPTFRDVSEEAGLVYAHYTPTSPDEARCIFDLPVADTIQAHADCEPEWSSAGAAVGDYDGDGWPDLFVTRLGAPDLLFHNRGDGTFEEVAAAVGLGACTFSGGATFADIDDDGDLDLAVTAMGGPAHHLYINEGGCFVDEAEARGFALRVDGLHAGTSVTFGDYDLDGILDAHVNEWIDAERVVGGPWGSRLLHGLGDGRFEDVTEAAGVSLMDLVPERLGAWGFASSFVDLDDDGRPDLAISVDYGASRIFWNAGDGTFVDGSEAAGIGGEENAMGSAFGDHDGDGRLDWFVTAIAAPSQEGCSIDECLWRGTGNRLYRNLGGRAFADVTDAAGVRDGGWGWGGAFFDLDHDGDLDLVMTNGWPGRGLSGIFDQLETPMRLWVNQGGGVFLEEGAARGIADRGQGRGLVTFDYDRDGDLDVFVANHAGRPALLRNEGGEATPWLAVEVAGSGSVRDGHGARVELEVDAGGPIQVREIGVGSHFLGEGELAAHFGVGAGVTKIHALRVRWPASGAEVTLTDLATSRRVQVVEP